MSPNLARLSERYRLEVHLQSLTQKSLPPLGVEGFTLWITGCMLA